MWRRGMETKNMNKLQKRRRLLTPLFACFVSAELARQLLEAGASASAPEEGGKFLQPLHLACMGQVCSTEQVSMRGMCVGLSWSAVQNR